MREKADNRSIKTLNELKLLNLIREQGPVARNQLARQTRISKVSVSDIINRLKDAGYVLEIGKGRSTQRGGKRPTLLKLNPENGYVIGIEIKRRHSIIALANIESEIQDIEQIDYQVGTSADQVIPAIFAKIDHLLSECQVEPEKLISIGIAIPGFVDYARGELLFADTLRGWGNLPLASRFSQKYRIPTILENDVNAITLGESLLGAGRGVNNFVCIWLGEGVGAGIVVDGQLIRGETGCAGEIGYQELGHCVVNLNKLKYLYSNQRYFGEILSELNLFEIMKIKCQWNHQDSEPAHPEADLQALLQAGDRGHQIIQEILDEYAFLLAILCMNLIKTLNPSLIILSGNVIENSKYLLEKVRQVVKQCMINIPFQPGSITMGTLKELAGVKGAIALALQTIFEPSATKNILG